MSKLGEKEIFSSLTEAIFGLVSMGDKKFNLSSTMSVDFNYIYFFFFFIFKTNWTWSKSQTNIVQ